jgi:hypothetical protein
VRLAAAFLLVALAHPALAAFDANGVTLGTSEKTVKQKFPNAHCQPLQWESRAADRRCDDSRITVGGIEARVTFYLKKDSVEAFDIRFDSLELDRFIALMTARFGKPVEEHTEKLRKFEWQDKREHAVLTAETARRRASLLVWRGAFEEEIYRVR